MFFFLFFFFFSLYKMDENSWKSLIYRLWELNTHFLAFAAADTSKTRKEEKNPIFNFNTRNKK